MGTNDNFLFQPSINSMDTRQLKAFIAVFEERNITRAAERLCLTQPTLSVTIRQLEDELACSLFTREARGVLVSEAARRLYPQAQHLLAQMTQLKAQFLTPQDCLPLTLGVEADIASSHLTALLRHCTSQLPQLLLEVLPGCNGDLRLASEELRCEDELFFPLWEESFVLAGLAQAEPRSDEIEARQAAQLDWIICPQHPSHQRLLAWLGGGGNAIATAHQAGSLQLARDMVLAGLGVALLPPSLLSAGLQSQRLAGAAPSRRLGLCYVANAMQRPAVSLLLEHLREQPL